MNRISNFHKIADSEGVNLKHLGKRGLVLSDAERAKQELFTIKSLLPKYTDYLNDDEISADNWLEKLEVIYNSIFLFNLKFTEQELKKLLKIDPDTTQRFENLIFIALNNLNNVLKILRYPVEDLQIQFAMLFIYEVLKAPKYAFFPQESRDLANEIIIKLKVICANQLENFVENLETAEKMNNSVALFLMETYIEDLGIVLARKFSTDFERFEHSYSLLSMCKILLSKRSQDYTLIDEMYNITSGVLVDIIYHLRSIPRSEEGNEYINEQIVEAIEFIEEALKAGLVGEKKINAKFQLANLHTLLGNDESAYIVISSDKDILYDLRRIVTKSGLGRMEIENFILYIDLAIKFAPKRSKQIENAESQLSTINTWLKEGFYTIVKDYEEQINKLKQEMKNRKNSST